jgi:hypothetical protein
MSLCTLFNYEFRKELLSETTQFFKGENVVDAAAFNIYGYLWRDAFVLYLS